MVPRQNRMDFIFVQLPHQSFKIAAADETSCVDCKHSLVRRLSKFSTLKELRYSVTHNFLVIVDPFSGKAVCFDYWPLKNISHGNGHSTMKWIIALFGKTTSILLTQWLIWRVPYLCLENHSGHS